MFPHSQHNSGGANKLVQFPCNFLLECNQPDDKKSMILQLKIFSVFQDINNLVGTRQFWIPEDQSIPTCPQCTSEILHCKILHTGKRFLAQCAQPVEVSF